MAEEIIDPPAFRRCVSEPTRNPLQQRYGPAIPMPDVDSEDKSGEVKPSEENSRPHLGVSEIGARAMQRIPYIMNDSDLNLVLGLMFAPAEESNELAEQQPESFYNEYFAPNSRNSSRSIPTEYGILEYDSRSIVKFNKDSPLYIQETFTGNHLFNINQEGSMQAIGLTMIPFCLPHNIKKTHWVQAIVVKELFPWNQGVQDNVMAVITPREFAAGMTYTDANRGIPMLHSEPIGLFLQDGSLQIYIASKHYTEPKIPGHETSKYLESFGIAIYFSEDSAFNTCRQVKWEHKTKMRTEPLGDVVALMCLFNQLKQMSDLRGMMRKIKGLTIHISHTLALGMVESICKEGGAEKQRFQEAWFKTVTDYVKEFTAIGWTSKFKWCAPRNNGPAVELAAQAASGFTFRDRHSDYREVQAACDKLAAMGMFDIKGIEHDENTPTTRVRDADWENMRVPPFLAIRYEEPFESLMRQLDIAEAEHDPHYNNEATPQEDIFNPENYPG